MIFNSTPFLYFFILFFTLFFILKNARRGLHSLILASSYLFYGWWDYRFLCLMLFSSSVDYLASLGIKNELRNKNILKVFSINILLFFLTITLEYNGLAIPEFKFHLREFYILLTMILTALSFFIFISKKKCVPKQYLLMSILVNLISLGFFKYYNFFTENLITLLGSIGFESMNLRTLTIILPVGISFYTFQSLSYSIDVYRKDIAPERSFLKFLCFVSFFPQLVAGPIERASNLMKYLGNSIYNKTPTHFYSDGIKLIIFGLFKKVYIADTLGLFVNSYFDGLKTITDSSSIVFLNYYLVIVFFAFQIYCDFSGYTDIARGLAKLMGIDLIKNFNLPYFSNSPSDFWRRWHISLSSWLRDYLYISLGGNRGGKYFVYRNLILTMAIGGLWHGASWNFVIWGCFHGIILVIYKAIGFNRKNKLELKNILFCIIMFNLTLIGWLFFRATTVQEILHFWRSLLNPILYDEASISYLKILIHYTTPLLIGQIFIALNLEKYISKNINKVLINISYAFCIYVIINYSIGAPENDFIYFAF